MLVVYLPGSSQGSGENEFISGAVVVLDLWPVDVVELIFHTIESHKRKVPAHSSHMYEL